jgi:hypothetical protein
MEVKIDLAEKNKKSANALESESEQTTPLLRRSHNQSPCTSAAVKSGGDTHIINIVCNDTQRKPLTFVDPVSLRTSSLNSSEKSADALIEKDQGFEVQK